MKQVVLKMAQQGGTYFLKTAIIMMGLIVLSLSIYWLPFQANLLGKMYPEFLYLKKPLMIGIYTTVIPFFFALYQAFKILCHIEKNNAFSKLSVKSLKYIKYCAISISLVYVIGINLLISQGAGQPGILLLGWTITFACLVIAVFAAVLKKLLQKILDIQREIELTV